MIRSMTGFVTKRKVLKGIGEIKINLRSLNYKYLDIRISRIPSEFEEIDRFIYENITKKIKRGRVDVTFNCIFSESVSAPARVVREIKSSFKKALEELVEFKSIQGDKIKNEIDKLIKYLIKRSEYFKEYTKKMKKEDAEINKDIFEEVALTGFYLKHLDKIVHKKKTELGKLLYFFSQELLRETNTILAKSKDKKISLQAVYFKEGVDRLREIAQNIE